MLSVVEARGSKDNGGKPAKFVIVGLLAIVGVSFVSIASGISPCLFTQSEGCWKAALRLGSHGRIPSSVMPSGLILPQKETQQPLLAQAQEDAPSMPAELAIADGTQLAAPKSDRWSEPRQPAETGEKRIREGRSTDWKEGQGARLNPSEHSDPPRGSHMDEAIERSLSRSKRDDRGLAVESNKNGEASGIGGKGEIGGSAKKGEARDKGRGSVKLRFEVKVVQRDMSADRDMSAERDKVSAELDKEAGEGVEGGEPSRALDATLIEPPEKKPRPLVSIAKPLPQTIRLGRIEREPVMDEPETKAGLVFRNRKEKDVPVLETEKEGEDPLQGTLSRLTESLISLPSDKTKSPSRTRLLTPPALASANAPLKQSSTSREVSSLPPPRNVNAPLKESSTSRLKKEERLAQLEDPARDQDDKSRGSEKDQFLFLRTTRSLSPGTHPVQSLVKREGERDSLPAAQAIPPPPDFAAPRQLPNLEPKKPVNVQKQQVRTIRVERASSEGLGSELLDSEGHMKGGGKLEPTSPPPGGRASLLSFLYGGGEESTLMGAGASPKQSAKFEAEGPRVKPPLSEIPNCAECPRPEIPKMCYHAPGSLPDASLYQRFLREGRVEDKYKWTEEKLARARRRLKDPFTSAQRKFRPPPQSVQAKVDHIFDMWERRAQGCGIWTRDCVREFLSGRHMALPLTQAPFSKRFLSTTNLTTATIEQIAERFPDVKEGSLGSCAIVGVSIDILDSGRGREIDSHDTVFRFNSPLEGFRGDLGAKTDILFWKQRRVEHLFGKAGTATEPLKFYFFTERQKYTMVANSKDRADYKFKGKKLLLGTGRSREAGHAAYSLYVRRASYVKMTTGFDIIMTVLSSRLCRRVDLYGFSAQGNGKYFVDKNLVQMSYKHMAGLEHWVYRRAMERGLGCIYNY